MMLVFVGALWGAIVFPVIASFYWNKVTNKAFTVSVILAVLLFAVARFELIPMDGVTAVFFELCATVGIGIVIGLMAFGFSNFRIALVIGTLAGVVAAPYVLGNLRDYTVLLSSLTAYGVSAIVCTLMSWRSKEDFDFSLLAKRVTSFHDDEPEAQQDTVLPGRELASARS